MCCFSFFSSLSSSFSLFRSLQVQRHTCSSSPLCAYKCHFLTCLSLASVTLPSFLFKIPHKISKENTYTRENATSDLFQFSLLHRVQCRSSTCIRPLSLATPPSSSSRRPSSPCWYVDRHARNTQFKLINIAPSPLPTPINKLIHIALGRGTQNYSCPANSNTTTIPISTGAIATLYNITSLRLHAASNDQHNLLTALTAGTTLTSYALSLPNPNGVSSSTTMNGTDCDNTTAKIDGWSALDLSISGHHYFDPSTSSNTSAPAIPHFDLNSIGLGSANAIKNGSSGAPIMSTLSIAPTPFNNASSTHANATTLTMSAIATDVPWLHLLRSASASNGVDVNGWKEVYRVNTRGGFAPANCVGLGLEGNDFIVEYASEYWFFG